ncbi:MAG: DUF2452 domain-containing protein [Bacteroidia bacterium]
MSAENKSKKDFVNPIDKDKITENPHSLEYAHTVGGALVKPEDKGKIKGRAVSSMHEQTNMQMGQIYEQMELLAKQAKQLQDRVEISERIYKAEMRFEPLISHIYYLYNKGEKDMLTMVAPAEWGRSMPYDYFIAKVKLLGDHTWEILEKGEGFTGKD